MNIRHPQRRKQRDDRNDHQQLDDGESASAKACFLEVHCFRSASEGQARLARRGTDRRPDTFVTNQSAGTSSELHPESRDRAGSFFRVALPLRPSLDEKACV